MYGSYGSYSSMSSVTQPLDIGSSSYLSSPSAYHQSSCAFPSWQRPERASSYLSDDDLLDLDDDSRSFTSGGSHSSASSNASGSPYTTVADEDFLHMQREQQAAMNREAIRLVVAEKERRKQQAQMAKRARRGSGGSAKKSPKAKSGAMAPIDEAVE
ncbi:hypothetical protein PFICI_08976 [Pestalotiopsis fici W106-1]|uniref:Uncharacterized protein n=1 Tax=Pestalotiopsis fici (strain W106-1 / CGMCC3.15140) TaxID=1229662 RepID=W3WZ30_PESFW|nr:uncharacterized protein PFICI_08976 [Pestalotiopsis fici W106-1]ETS79123.1 hypothetical protein PFICI_08976 [Pestalotiopsis fici W106-1]